MSDYEYNKMRLIETIKTCRDHFNVSLPIKEVLFDDIETGPNSYCVLFRTQKNDIYALFQSTSKQTFADVKRAAKAMGLNVEGYFAPYGDRSHFTRYGFAAFQDAYPGRNSWTAQEARYYKTLAPYAPALVRVSRVNGEIRRFNSHDSHWHKVFDFKYAKMKVQ